VPLCKVPGVQRADYSSKERLTGRDSKPCAIDPTISKSDPGSKPVMGGPNTRSELHLTHLPSSTCMHAVLCHLAANKLVRRVTNLTSGKNQKLEI